MKITAPLTALLDPGRKESASLLRRLVPGQQLNASVISIPRAGVAQLQIGLTALLARSQLPLAPGMQLKLAVTKLHPVPELRVLLTPTSVQPRDRVIGSALPRQIPLTDALQGLAQHVQQRQVRLPDEAQVLINRLLARSTPPPQLNATGIREQLRTSGLFLEQTLARGASPLAGDLKLDFLRLLRLLQAPTAAGDTQPGSATAKLTARTGSVLEQLARLVEGAVARIQTQQAASLPHDQETRQLWQFDLPVLLAGQHESVQVRVEREAPADDAAGPTAPRWSVTLRFDFEITGLIQARIVLNGECVGSTFWCERADTERRVGNALPTLETALRNSGLEVGRLTSVHGEPPDPIILPRPVDQLVDTHA